MPHDDRPTDYADRVLREAMTAATAGLDATAAEAALTSATQAIAKQMAALEAQDYEGMSPDQGARALPHTTKAAGVLFRLVWFARGKPCRRPSPRHACPRGLDHHQR